MIIKNLFLIILIYIIVSSCGKKGDPVYKEKITKSKILIHKVSRSI